MLLFQVSHLHVIVCYGKTVSGLTDVRFYRSFNNLIRFFSFTFCDVQIQEDLRQTSFSLSQLIDGDTWTITDVSSMPFPIGKPYVDSKQ